MNMPVGYPTNAFFYKGEWYNTDGEGAPVTVVTNPLTGVIENITVSGEPVLSFSSGSFAPYRLATFGDSRANAGGTHLTTVSAVGLSGERVPVALCQARGDMQIVFNGGVSGDLVSNWNSAARGVSSQTVKDLLSSSPDLVYIQYGINDFVGGASADTVAGHLKSLIDKILGAGIPVVFESCNPCAAASVSYINGYASSGGFGANSADKLAEMQACNATMKAWLDQFPGNVALYVDTSPVSTADDGYAKADKTYYDGTHMSRLGCSAAARLVDAAIRAHFPLKHGQRIRSAYPNGINRSFLNPTSGRAANMSAVSVENGAATAEYRIVTDEAGDICQEYSVTVTSIGGSTARLRFDMLPDWAGASPFFAMSAGDVLRGAFDYQIDDGAGGGPIAYLVYGRGRIFYNDATNAYTDHGSVAVTTSTDFPTIAAAEKGKILTPGLAVKAGMSSTTMLATTALQCYVITNQTGVFRLRIKNPQWCKV